MKFKFYVIFSRTQGGKPKQRITHRNPSLFKGEVAVKMSVDVPDAHFLMVIENLNIQIDPPLAKPVITKVESVSSPLKSTRSE